MLTQLREIVEQVNLADSLEAAMKVLVGDIRRVMVVDCCSVYLAHESLSYFTLAATDGLAATAVGQTHIAFSEGVVGLVGQ